VQECKKSLTCVTCEENNFRVIRTKKYPKQYKLAILK
jgi:hypothetical protein